MKSWQGYWCYVPIVICLVIGYAIGGYLSFGIKFLNAFPDIHEQSARFVLMLFGMGMLGATTFSSKFWAEDINEVVYENEKFLPHFFDFFGYASRIIEGGIMGVVLFLLIKSGVGMGITQPNAVTLNLPISLVVAYCGGLFHYIIVKRLTLIVKKALKDFKEK